MKASVKAGVKTGVKDGYRYSPMMLGGSPNIGESYDGPANRGNLVGVGRIKVDAQGNDIGRDYEAFDPTGNYTHSHIGDTQSGLDKVALFILKLLA